MSNLHPEINWEDRMSHTIKLIMLTCWLALAVSGSTQKLGDMAPQFSLPSVKGSMVPLKAYMGQSKVVLVFYRGYW